MLLGIAIAPSALAAGKYFGYVGTYTREKSKGIYSFRFDPASGEVSPVELAAEVANPSFLIIHPNRKFLYAVSELGNGAVYIFFLCRYAPLVVTVIIRHRGAKIS